MNKKTIVFQQIFHVLNYNFFLNRYTIMVKVKFSYVKIKLNRIVKTILSKRNL